MKATRIITTVFIALASLAAHAQEGAWNGELNIMGTKLPLVFNFSTKAAPWIRLRKVLKEYQPRRLLRTMVQ